MSGFFNFPGTANPDLTTPADFIDPFDTGLYIAKDGSEENIRDNLVQVMDRARDFLMDRSGRKPYAYPFASTWAQERMDPFEAVRTIAMHQRHYQDRAIFSAGNGYVNPYNYAYHPCIIAYITRWRFQLTSVVTRNPLVFRCQRNNAIYEDFLTSDRISRIGGGALNKYFTTPSDTHGFGNAQVDYTDDGVGIPCRFTRLPTNRGSNVWGTLMNHDGPDNQGRIFYLRARGPSEVVVYLDQGLTNVVNAGSRGWPALSDQELLEFGRPLAYAAEIDGGNKPSGQIVHVDVFNLGEKQFRNSSGDAVTPYLEFLRSMTQDFDQSLYPQRRSTGHARMLTGKSASGGITVNANLHDAHPTTYRPEITINADSDGRLTGVTWNPECSGLFVDFGAGYSEGREVDGVSFLDAHIMELSTGVTPADERGIGGTATSIAQEVFQPAPRDQQEDFRINRIVVGDTSNNRETRVTFNEDVSLPDGWDLSMPIVVSGARRSSGSAFHRDYANGVAHGFELLSPREGRFYHFDGTTTPDLERTGSTATLLGGTLTIAHGGFTAAAFGQPAIDPDNAEGTQVWPNHVAPSSVDVRLVHQGSQTRSISGVKRRTTIGTRSYLLSMSYELITRDEWKVFEVFAKSVKGQFAQFKLPIFHFAKGDWGQLFRSHPESVAVWNRRSIYPAQPSHLPGDNHLFLTGFEGVANQSPGPVVRAGDILTVYEPDPVAVNQSRFLEVAEDAHANRLGEAAIRLVSPVKRAFSSSQQVSMVETLEYLHVTLDSNAMDYSFDATGHVSFEVGFEVMA